MFVRSVDELLVEFCRSGALAPLVLGMSASEVEKRIGQPGRVNVVQGDDCWQRYNYTGTSLSLFLRCHVPEARHRAATHRLGLRLTAITICVAAGAQLILPEAIVPAPIRPQVLLFADLHRLLIDGGVEVTNDGDQRLSRALDHAYIQVEGLDGLVRRIEATRRQPADAASVRPGRKRAP